MEAGGGRDCAGCGQECEGYTEGDCEVKAADLFCGAGGAAMGLSRAGFEVEGWDIKPQPHYPFTFHLGDALQADLSGFDFVWASPPCQAYTAMQNLRKNGHSHQDLVEPTRRKLEESGLPWVIENVKGSPLRTSIMLCGTMFGLRIIKHRYFETNMPIPLTLSACDHSGVFDPWHGKGRTANEMREAQGTPWIPIGGGASRKQNRSGDLNNAIPPAYSEFLGRQIIGHMNTVKPARDVLKSIVK